MDKLNPDNSDTFDKMCYAIKYAYEKKEINAVEEIRAKCAGVLDDIDQYRDDIFSTTSKLYNEIIWQLCSSNRGFFVNFYHNRIVVDYYDAIIAVIKEYFPTSWFSLSIYDGGSGEISYTISCNITKEDMALHVETIEKEIEKRKQLVVSRLTV